MGVRDGLHVNVWRWGNGKGRGRAGKERHQQELEMTNIPCPPWGRCLPVQTATRQSKRPALWWTRGVNPSVWSVANVCISHFEVSDNCASLQMFPTNRLDETEHLLKKSYKFHLSQGMHYCRRKMTALYLRSTSEGEGSSGYRDSSTLEECTLAMAPRGKKSEKA